MSTETSLQLLIGQNRSIIQQGRIVLGKLGREEFTASLEGSGTSSTLGKHFRHVINFYENLCSVTGDAINYDKRIRDPQIEQSAEYASHKLEQIDNILSSWSGSLPNLPECPRLCIGEVNGSLQHIETSLARELKFVLEHTLHHFAIIGLVMRSNGHELPEHFGVAPSTIAYAGG